jgi:hypothetical protein
MGNVKIGVVICAGWRKDKKGKVDLKFIYV